MERIGFSPGSVKVVRETDKAILVVLDKDQIWIPKSQITDDSNVWKEGQEGDLYVSEWFAEQRGWI